MGRRGRASQGTLQTPQDLQTLRHIPICDWPFFTHSENHCSIHPMYILYTAVFILCNTPGVYYNPRCVGLCKKRMKTVLIIWNLSLQDEKQRWFFSSQIAWQISYIMYSIYISFLLCVWRSTYKILNYHV